MGTVPRAVTRVIGLDHGSRRIGVAVGDTETGIAFARPAVTARSVASAADAVARIAAEEGIVESVIGLPLNMDGSEGPQAASARAFGEALARIGLDVAYVDERLTSWQAEERLGANRGRAGRGGEVDSEAARLILQEYLDARRTAGHLEETE